MKSYFAYEEPGFAWHDRYKALSYHTASRHVQQNVFTRAVKHKLPGLVSSRTICLRSVQCACSYGAGQNFIQARINL